MCVYGCCNLLCCFVMFFYFDMLCMDVVGLCMFVICHFCVWFQHVYMFFVICCMVCFYCVLLFCVWFLTFVVWFVLFVIMCFCCLCACCLPCCVWCLYYFCIVVVVFCMVCVVVVYGFVFVCMVCL